MAGARGAPTTMEGVAEGMRRVLMSVIVLMAIVSAACSSSFVPSKVPAGDMLREGMDRYRRHSCDTQARSLPLRQRRRLPSSSGPHLLMRLGLNLRTSGKILPALRCSAEEAQGFDMQPVEGDASARSEEASMSYRERFDDVLPSWLIDRLEACGFCCPTPVQSAAIETIVRDCKDALVQAYTGSGKTLAFMVPLFAVLEQVRDGGGHGSSSVMAHVRIDCRTRREGGWLESRSCPVLVS